MSKKESNDNYFSIRTAQDVLDKNAKKVHNCLFMYEELAPDYLKGLTKAKHQLEGLGCYFQELKLDKSFIDALLEISYLESKFEDLEGSFEAKQTVLRRSILDIMNRLRCVSRELHKHVGA